MSKGLTRQYDLSTQGQNVQTVSKGIKYCVFEIEKVGSKSAVRGDKVKSQYAHLVISNPDENSPVRAIWVKGCNNKSEGLEVDVHVLGVSDNELNNFYSGKDRPCSLAFFSQVSEETKKMWLNQFNTSLDFANRQKIVTKAVQAIDSHVNVKKLTERIIIQEKDSLDYARLAGGGKKRDPLSIPERVIQSLTQVGEKNLFSDDAEINNAIVDIIRGVLTQQFAPKMKVSNVPNLGLTGSKT